ncbi:GNAT family N-acetyltransferase [Streptomyces sp. NPDC020096]
MPPPPGQQAAGHPFPGLRSPDQHQRGVNEVLSTSRQETRETSHDTLVFVERAARNAGVGRLLLEEMLAWASANRVDRIQLNANPNSARLYQRAGFGPAPARLMEMRL